MFKVIWPVLLVGGFVSGAIIVVLSLAGVSVLGLGLPIGMIVAICTWPWLFKRLDAAADRGEL